MTMETGEPEVFTPAKRGYSRGRSRTRRGEGGERSPKRSKTPSNVQRTIDLYEDIARARAAERRLIEDIRKYKTSSGIRSRSRSAGKSRSRSAVRTRSSSGSGKKLIVLL